MKKINEMRQDGFTLIEILMTVLIIVILAVVGITQFNNFAADAKNAATKSNLAILRNSIGVMNALERVRCQKTSVLFPDITTLTGNDITGCLGSNTTIPAVTVACDPVLLVDPKTALVYGTDCGVAFAAGNYLTLIPLVDHPYVQNQIPNNPWTGPASTAAPNLIQQDTSPAAGTISCVNAPNDTFGTSQTNATECATVTAAFNTTPATADSGWCYCQETGQIWANSARNDGAAGATGNESTF